MALKFFRGRLDLAKLTLADLADAAAALSTLERLAASGAITFASGASRNAGSRPDMAERMSGKARAQQQQDILAALREGGPMRHQAILDATGMKENSLTPNLTKLVRDGLVSKTIEDRPKGKAGRPSREFVTYAIKTDV